MYTDKVSNPGVTVSRADSAHEKQISERAAVETSGELAYGAVNAYPGMIAPPDAATVLQNQGMISPSNSTAHNGFIAPAGIEETLKESKGSGEPMAMNIQGEMRRKLGGDYSDVQIHTDSRADKLAKSLNAKAFTYGRDIYFANGQYDTTGTEGKNLLKHELLHAQENVPVIQRETVNSLWGEFKAEDYADLDKEFGPDDRIMGAEIVIWFKPNELVDAKKIGITQISKEYLNGTPEYLDETERKQSIQQKDSVVSHALNEKEHGFQIDQFPNKINPLYAVNKAKPGQSLKDAKTSKRYGRHGWRYTDDSGTLQEQTAGIGDGPQTIVPNDANDAGMVFETTALAIDSKTQQNKYYGSVQWGWRYDKTGGYKRLPFTIASEGAASTTFLKAASMWNLSKDKKGRDTLKLPIPEYYCTSETTVFYGGETFSASNGVSVDTPFRVERLEAKTPVKEMPQLVPVKVIDGDFAGITGWIDGGKLEKENITVHPYEEPEKNNSDL